MSQPNLDHVRRVKQYVHSLLYGLPALPKPISYAEISMGLQQLANEYDAIAAGEDETAIPS